MEIGGPVIVRSGEKRGEEVFDQIKQISTRRDDPSFFEEDLLQRLIDTCPGVLPVAEFFPATAALFSLGREISVDLGDNEGLIDNLLVTNEGYLVVVETKLYRNPEAIRQVVAQILQYGMALGRIPVLELETRLAACKRSGVKSGESIREFVFRQAAADSQQFGLLQSDFDEAFERHLRRGECLMLIVSDSIRVGVERVTHWLNEVGSSAPFKFGLVELKFHELSGHRLVVPRTVLKTSEVSRHIVVVDIRPTTAVSVESTVTDEFLTTTGGKGRETRDVRAATPSLTKPTYLRTLAAEERGAASKLIEQLEILRFEQQGTPSTLKFGFTTEDGEFHSLITFDKSGAWTYLLKKDKDRLGADATLAFRRESNQFGLFYRDEQVGHSDSVGCAVKSKELEPAAAKFAAFLDDYRTKIKEAWQRSQ